MSDTAANIVQKAAARYPWLKQYDVQFQDSVGRDVDHRGEAVKGRKLEFYPPDESWNPKPGKVTVEQFDPAMSEVDVMGELISHYIPKIDPKARALREKFIGSIDDKQREMLFGDYRRDVDDGLYGDYKPTFDRWLQTNGGDAFFRGYLANQYPREYYRDDQVKIFDELVKHLNQGGQQ